MNTNLHKFVIRMSKYGIYVLIALQSLTMVIADGIKAQRKMLDEMSIDLREQNESNSLIEIFKEIEASTDFKFAYSRKEIKNKAVNLEKGAWKMDELLKIISVQAKVSFRRVNEQIGVSIAVPSQKLPTLIEKVDIQVFVEGTVTDENGEPLPGATVLEKGTTNGTITDIDGNFSINVDEGATLLISFVGFKIQEVPVAGKSRVDVSLEPDISALEEVVVVGYGTQQKKDVTGAVSSIRSADILNSAAISIDQALQGRIAGVQMTQNTGAPGGGTSIQIRGLNSINSTNEPIFVIDGVIINSGTNSYTDNAFASISPSDIESIDVLKDASAAAIYGAQGANGVIIITTKRGKEGKPRVTLDAQYSNQYIPKYIEMTNLREYATHQNELYTLRGWGISDEFANPSILSEGTNWQKEIFEPASMENYNFAISGGSAETTYKFTGSYLDQEGIAAGSGFKRLYVSTAVDSEINSWLKGGLSLTFTNTDQVITITDWSLINSALRQSPSVPARNLDGTYGGPEDANDALSNPLALAELIDRGSEKTGGRGNLYIEVKPVKWLTVRSEVAADINVNQGRTFVPTYELGNRKNSQIENTRTINYGRFLVWRNWATAKYKFADRHDVSMMLGYELNENTGNNLMGRRFGGSNQLSDLDAGDASTAVNSGSTYRRAFTSYFGRVFYSYADRYMLTATVRRDGSSNFAEGYQWGTFPSASIAWRVSEEPFFVIDNLINDMKIRFGYGETGNSNIRAFSHTALLSNVPTIWGTGHLVANVPNQEVTWETTISYNLGLDLGLFGNRIELVADVYKKRTDDLLLALTLPGITGAGGGQGSAAPPWDNVGSMENKGVELSLNTVNMERDDFQWTSNFIYTLNRNKVLQLNTESAYIDRRYQTSGTDHIVTRTEAGRSIGEFYGYKIVGRINSADDLLDSEGNVKIPIPEDQIIDEDNGIWVGDFIWEDYNQDSVINEEDRQYLGSPLPKFTYGIGNTFSYKNFDLNIFLTGSYGNKVMNFLGLTIENPNNTGITKRAATRYAKLDLVDPEGPVDDIYNVYVSSGDPDLPRMSVNDVNANATRLSSRLIEDGSYLRIQNVSLAYNAPASLTSKIGMQSLRVVVSVKNLYTFTKYSGYDPEVGMVRHQYSNYSQDALLNGIDVGRYPSPRIFSLGLFVGF